MKLSCHKVYRRYNSYLSCLLQKRQNLCIVKLSGIFKQKGSFMKKLFVFLTVALCFFINFSNSAVSASVSWPELTQKERDEYISGTIKDIQTIDNIDISKETLERQFQLKNGEKDPNYRKHRNGQSTLPGVRSKLITKPSITTTYSYTTHKTEKIPLLAGYALISDNITISFSSSGYLKDLTATSKVSEYGTYIKKEYDKSLNLIKIIYFDKPYEIIFDSEYNVQRIKEFNKSYAVNGDEI